MTQLLRTLRLRDLALWASVFIMRRREPHAERPFRVPGYPWTPLLFVVSAAALVLNVMVATPWDAAKGLAIVALGCPVYWLVFRDRKQAENSDLSCPEAITNQSLAP